VKKKGGRNHSLFTSILDGVQTNTISIGSQQNLSNEINPEVLENRPGDLIAAKSAGDCCWRVAAPSPA